MDLLTEKQISELIVEYENRNKAMVEKIKEELQNRKELKKKFEEAKQREALQLQILERLEESEKMVRKQLDLVAKMEDNESLKQLQLIKKYEQMLDEQKKTWDNYKAQYESLPSVKKVREAEAELLRANIQYGLLVQKMKDTQRMVQLREMVRKQQERAQIIKFAKMYVEHMKKQKRCEELWDQNRKLLAQAQQLRSELQEREKAKLQRLDAELKKASPLMKPQQLPQVDLSRFIIHRYKGNDKLDAMSVNSYILEQEYMNNNGQSNPKSNNSQNKTMDVDTQETMHMDIDTQGADSQGRELVQSNEPPKRLNFEGAFDNEAKTQCTPHVAERNNNEMQNHVQSNSSNQSRSQVVEHNRTSDQTMDSQESHQSYNDASGGEHSSRKRANPKQQQNKENTPMHVSFVNVNDGNAQNNCSSPYNRPVPTPAKMTKSAFQEKFPHQQMSKQEQLQQQQYQQEISQQNQQQKSSKRFLQENQQQQNQFQQQQQKRSSQEMMQLHQQQQQQQQSSRHSSQEMYQQEMYQQQQQQQQSRHPPQEMYQQNQNQQDAYLRSEQHQVSPQNSEQMDFSRLPSNKPRIVSNEYVNYDLQALQRKQNVGIQPKAEPMTPRTSMETTTTSTMAKTPYAQQGPFAFGLNSSVNVTPVSVNIEPSSMMSTTMHSIDNLLPDNISAILGSEITEPGGSLELAKRFYDSDFNSECSDFDIDKMMSNLSPMPKISPKAQHTQAPTNNNAQPPVNNSITQNAQDQSSNPNDRGFTFGGFARTQTSTNQRLF